MAITPRKCIKISVQTHQQLLALRNQEAPTVDAVIAALIDNINVPECLTQVINENQIIPTVSTGRER